MREFKPYIGPALILVLGLLLICFLYRSLSFTENTEKSLAVLLPVIGFVFAIFQVFLNIAVQSVRNTAQLRHAEYKELGKILNSISELLNENMIKELNIHGLVNSLLNRINEFQSFISNNDTYLFPGIQKKKIAIETKNELDEILIWTDRFRKEIENAKSQEIDRVILEMNWHNKVRDNLMRYNNLKYKLLKEVQRCIK